MVDPRPGTAGVDVGGTFTDATTLDQSEGVL
jgi:N-methylhydantoinase A/oxoprolinase/acetone carboxylase beta subunit